jgi:perosamine synthetase
MESSLSKLLDVDFGFAVSNGSAAIRMALLALGFRPGMRVILPGWGFHVAANIAYAMGAKIEFRDVDPDTWCMNLDGVLESIGETEDVFLVLIHTLGNTSNLELLEKQSRYSGLRIIEDSAEAMFSKFHGKNLGTFFDAGTYSFHAAKTITTGEGGFVTVNSTELATKCRLIRSHGMKSEKPYFHEIAGDNFRLSNLLAAIAIGQINEVEIIWNKRMKVYSNYLNELSGIAEDSFIRPSDPTGFFPWGFGLRLGSKRNLVARQLAELGIETRPGFSSASQLPYIGEALVADNGVLGHSNKLSQEVLLLPHYPDLTDENITEICEIILAEIL